MSTQSITPTSSPESVPLVNGMLAGLLAGALQDQQALTAVERFSQRHDDADYPLLQGSYRDLIPLSKPGVGEQYAFEVDLDACSGCKACVAACHNLNGLEENELWRNVGVLYGGTNTHPVIQHITTACHHCVEPACMNGCPVLAYDKDPLTGIVRHLDDQCIGCQYCVFMCPYDVPQYSATKGIVRKCDMCHDRLGAGEAPACVQSCPNEAIRITTISIEKVAKKCSEGTFLPSSPDPRMTRPTTTFKSAKPIAENLLPSDYFTARPQHSHLALVLMLVLTQLSVGAFVVGQFLVWGPWTDPLMHSAIRPIYAMVGLVLGIIGMNTAVFHLGRPLYAYRALLGLRTSWLSREILAFSIFGGLAMSHAALVWMALYYPAWNTLADWLGFATAAGGLLAVFCSVMICVQTRRPFWAMHRTVTKFLMSCVVLGLPCAMLVSLAASLWEVDFHASHIMAQYGQQLCGWIIICAAAKLLLESTIFVHLMRSENTPLKRTAILLSDDLGQATMLRYFFGIVGGLVLPTILLSDKATATDGFHPLSLIATVSFSFVMLSVGEMTERYLYFAASVAAKMPGAAAS